MISLKNLRNHKSIGITHSAYNKLRNLRNYLRFNMYLDDFGESINTIMINHEMEASYWHKEFQKLCKEAWKKLYFIMKEHESIEFLKAVRIFDSEQAPFVAKEVEDYMNLYELNHSTNVLHEEFKKYLKCNIAADYEKGPIEFWKTRASSFPNL